MKTRAFIKTLVGTAACLATRAFGQSQNLTQNKEGWIFPNAQGLKLITLAKVERWLRSQPSAQWQAVRGACTPENYRLECINAGLARAQDVKPVVHPVTSQMFWTVGPPYIGWWLEFGLAGEGRTRLSIACRTPLPRFADAATLRWTCMTVNKPEPVWLFDNTLARNIFEDPAFWAAMR